MIKLIKSVINTYRLACLHKEDLRKIDTLQADIRRAVALLNDMENMIKHNNWTSTQKKFFWINFRSDEEYRRDVFKQMSEYYSTRNLHRTPLS